MNGAEPVARPAMMDLNELARAVGGEVAGAAVEFSGVTTDSRQRAARNNDCPEWLELTMPLDHLLRKSNAIIQQLFEAVWVYCECRHT